MNYIRLNQYNVQIIQTIEERMSAGKVLIVEYREENGDRLSGVLIDSFTSTAGIECASVNNFANVVACEAITGHYIGARQ